MITIRTVEALAPGEAIWDDRLKGFGCRRQSRGCSYVLKYRVNGRQQFLTLGQHGPLTPDTARRKAKAILGQVATGADPAAERAETKSNTAHSVARIAEKFLAYVEDRQRPRYFEQTKRHLLKNWKPLHSISIYQVQRRDVAAALADITEGHGPVQATQARLALSLMFKWAIGEGHDLVNPVIGTNPPGKAKSRKRVLTDAELKAIWNACDDSDYGRIVRLLMLTLQRRDEVGGLLRDEISADLWTIGEDRTKNHREHTLPLPAAALAIVTDALASTNRDFAFGRGPRGDTERGFSGWSKAKADLDAKLTFTDWTLHDLRRTGATVMADRLDVLPHIIEAVLNHVSGHKAGVAGVYNHARYLPQMRDALDHWSTHVTSLTASKR